jgi:hypothetical protein
MQSLLLAAAYGLAIFSAFGGVVITAHGLKNKAAIPFAGGIIYTASAIALLGALAGV